MFPKLKNKKQKHHEKPIDYKIPLNLHIDDLLPDEDYKPFDAEGHLAKASMHPVFLPINKLIGEKEQFLEPIGCMPLIPPREQHEAPTLPDEDPNDKSTWFIVQSPREVKGIAGPFTVKEMKRMYKYGEIKDTTLVWEEGKTTWTKINYMTDLRPKLLQLPVIPPKRIFESDELFDPIPKSLSQEEISMFKDFEVPTVSKTCEKCGNVAAGKIEGVGEQNPDLTAFRAPEGSTKLASEIIPGFLWLGNAASAKTNPINNLGITLAINCTSTLKNVPPCPPYFRCKVCPLDEKPGDRSPEALQVILAEFERCYDWIENERSAPERAHRQDFPEPEYRGPTDHLGQPVPEDLRKFLPKPPKRPEFAGKVAPSRVLLWSRLGFDRPCAVVAAYLIKFWGITASKALQLVEDRRPGMKITKVFKYALREWARRYSLSMMLCIDCMKQAPKPVPIQDNSVDHFLALLADATAGDEEVDRGGAQGGIVAASVDEAGDDQPSWRKGLVLQLGGDPSMFIPAVYDQPLHAAEKNALIDIELEKIQSGKRAALEIDPDSDVSAYDHMEPVVVVPSMCFTASLTSIHDLILCSLQLTDEDLSVICAALASADLMARLRVVNLQDNKIGSVGLQQLVSRLLPSLLDPSHISNGEAAQQLKPVLELTDLTLSHNLIGPGGGDWLAWFLRGSSSIVNLNVFDNDLGDTAVASIFAALTRPLVDFIDEDAETEVDGLNTVPYNNTLTALNLGSNKIGSESAAALSEMLKNNSVLTSLQLDYNNDIPRKDFKTFMASLRMYNQSLSHLSFNDTPLTVKSAGYIFKGLEGRDCPLSHLALARCSLAGLHVASTAKHFLDARHLLRLDLSGNQIGDTGATFVSTGIRGKAGALQGTHFPPLRHLDLSECGLGPVGAREVLLAASTRTCLKYLDMSHNNIGPSISDIEDNLSCFQLKELKLNDCRLLSAGTGTVLAACRNTVPDRLGGNLLSLSLASNEATDNVAPYVQGLLIANSYIEFIDLGYNKLTQDSSTIVKKTLEVTSKSLQERQLRSLTVALIGNPCDPHMLEMPGMARSKACYQFGTKGTRGEDDRNIRNPMTRYDHVPEFGRAHYLERKQEYDAYCKLHPSVIINTIS